MRNPEMRMIPKLFDRRARTHVDHIHNRAPVAAKLAQLLRIDIDQQGYLVGVLHGLGLHERQLDSAADNCVQNPHQGSLSITIANVENMHWVLQSILFQKPFLTAMPPPAPSDKHWPRDGIRIPATRAGSTEKNDSAFARPSHSAPDPETLLP